MTTPSILAAGLVQALCVDFLLKHKHSNPRTLAMYRDAFRLLLRFVHETYGVEPGARRIENLHAPIILAFLDHIERQRANCIRSRMPGWRPCVLSSDLFKCGNQRRLPSLHACSPFRSSARSANSSDTSHVPRSMRSYRPPIRTNWDGRRVQALLLTLYKRHPPF